jgi:hypothetical protein
MVMSYSLASGWIAISLALGPLLPADEAIRLDGRRLPGKLTWSDHQRLRFVANGQEVSLAEIHRIRFPAGDLPFRAETVRRVLLPGNQWLTGEWLGLDDRTLQLRTAWAARLSIPRPAIVALTQALANQRHPAGDPEQDEIWLGSGDQVFGTILAADRRQIDLRGRFGQRSFAWSEVRGIYFRRPMLPPRTTEGDHVRIGVRSGLGTEDDLLEGTVQALDTRRLVLRHAVLGEVAIDRARLAWLTWLYYGQRMELDNGLHHLGRQPVAGLPARPEGLSLQRTFALTAVPDEANLVIEVVYLQGPGAGPALAEALPRGGLRTEVLVNGRVLDYLNRHVERSVRTPSRLRLPLPRLFLRTGTNDVEVRQTPDPETGRYENCGVSALAIEIPQ